MQLKRGTGSGTRRLASRFSRIERRLFPSSLASNALDQAHNAQSQCTLDGRHVTWQTSRSFGCWVVLDNLADRIDRTEILSAYPSLVSRDIDAAIEYAAELARERVVPLTPGAA
jgi:hypothetical protein